MKKAILAGSFLLLTAAGALCANQPIGIQGMNIGMKSSDVVARLKADGNICFNYACDRKLHIKGFTFDSVYSFDKEYKNPDAAINRISITFPPEMYETLYDALREKYGKPKATDSNKVRNAYGFEGKNALAVWSRPDGRIQIMKYAGSLKTGEMIMVDRKIVEEEDRDLQKAQAEGM